MESSRYLGSGLAALAAALVVVALSARPALAAVPALTPSAQNVESGETIDLSVTGFKRCPALQSPAVLWDSEPLSYNVVAGPLTSTDFTVSIVVPISSIGAHSIYAGCPLEQESGYALQLHATVNVVPPTLTPAQQIVQAGQTVTMTGSGFALCTDPAGGTTVELSANGTLLAMASGSNGDFQQVITVPAATSAGPYAVTAECSGLPASDIATADVSVVTLALSPDSGTPGTTITVTGAGFTQCHEVQLQLLRDTTQAVAASGPIVPANGGFTVDVTVPSSAATGTDYQVDARCYPAAGSNPAIAIDPFAVIPLVTSPSPTPTSSSGSSGPSSPPSPSPTPSPSSTGSRSSPAGTSSSGHTGGLWVQVALAGSTGAGLVLAGLLLVRALSMLHGRRGPRWVSKHLRAVARTTGTMTADIEDRPGAVSVSVGLEPHIDHLGNQQYEEVTR
jgi:hypothetical protein